MAQWTGRRASRVKQVIERDFGGNEVAFYKAKQIPRGTLAKWRNNEREPSQSFLLRLARETDRNPRWLAGDDVPEYINNERSRLHLAEELYEWLLATLYSRLSERGFTREDIAHQLGSPAGLLDHLVGFWEQEVPKRAESLRRTTLALAMDTVRQHFGKGKNPLALAEAFAAAERALDEPQILPGHGETVYRPTAITSAGSQLFPGYNSSVHEADGSSRGINLSREKLRSMPQAMHEVARSPKKRIPQSPKKRLPRAERP